VNCLSGQSSANHDGNRIGGDERRTSRLIPGCERSRKVSLPADTVLSVNSVMFLRVVLVAASLMSVTLGCGGTEPPHVRHASVVRVDATSGRVKAVVPVGVDPLQLAVAARQVWTLEFGEGTLARIDPETNKPAAVDIGEAAGMASDGDDIWVAANGNTLLRLDGESGKRERVLKLARKPLFELRDAGFLTVSAGSIWLTIPVLGDNSADQTLWRIDPPTGAVTARAPLLANPVSLAADARYVWVANIDGGKVTRVDVMTNAAKNVAASIGPAGVAIGAGSLWVSHYVPEVWRIDPDTMRVQAKIHLDAGTTRGIAFAGGRVWVTTESGVVALDPATNKVVQTIELIEPKREVGPTAIAYLDGDLWVSIE
jgi:DNA-binding beta-propeller fold protein YncE